MSRSRQGILTEPDSERTPHSMNMLDRFEEVFGAVGARTIDGFAYIGGLAALTGEAAYVTFVGPFRGQRLRPQRAIHQAMAVGVEAILIVSMITFFVGL